MLEFLGADIATKLFWAKIQYFGILGLPLAYFWFALEFSGRKAWLTRTRIFSLALIPITILLLVLSNESHRLIWPSWYLELVKGTQFLYLEHGIAFWVNITYTYFILIASTVLMLTTIARRPELYRKQITVLLIGVFAPWVGNVISNLGLLLIPIDLTPFGFTVTGLAITWGIFRHSFMHIAPIAHETVFENMNDAVFILDLRNIVVDANTGAQQTLGLSADELIGKHAREAFAGQVDLLERFKHIINTRVEITISENSLVHYYELSIFPLTDRKENRVGRAIVLHDIADNKQASIKMKKAHDEALRANQIKSEFLARVSHELRSPLGVIRGYADLMSDPDYGTLTDFQTNALSEIIESTQRVSDMVGELLDEARLTSGTVEPEIRQFSPIDILNNAKGKLSVLAKKKELLLSTEFDPELPSQITSDPTFVNQMITNLVANAIKFTETGEVSIKLYCAGKEHWAIEVTDTGSGIPEEAIESVFEPFRQADNTITRVYGGTGLGLSIVKHLVELLYGKIKVKSKIGEGSTFTITLPIKYNEKVIE